jgi:hypothetical protein
MWEPRPLTTLRTSTTCHRNSFTFTVYALVSQKYSFSSGCRRGGGTTVHKYLNCSVRATYPPTSSSDSWCTDYEALYRVILSVCTFLVSPYFTSHTNKQFAHPANTQVTTRHPSKKRCHGNQPTGSTPQLITAAVRSTV